VIGAPGEIRTPDPQVRSLMLYPAELRALQFPVAVKPVARERAPTFAPPSSS
jgi:hypothetical protein